MEDDAGQLGFSETVLLQVLVKLVQGLLQVYECCKGNVMSSLISLQSLKKNDNIEGRFVSLVSIVMKKENNGDQGSKYLTQAQRFCLELHQKTTLSSSSKAFEMFAEHASQNNCSWCEVLNWILIRICNYHYLIVYTIGDKVTMIDVLIRSNVI